MPISKAAPAREGGNAFLDPIIGRGDTDPAAPFATYVAHGTERTVSQAAFRARALQFLALLRESGAAPGDLVLMILRHGLDAQAAFMGAMLGGMVPSFLPYPNARQDHQLYWRQHRTVFGHCGARLALVYDELCEAVAACTADIGITVLPLSRVDYCPACAMPSMLPGEDEIALLQHSSGTTGLKKGVALSYRSIVQQIARYADSVGLNAPAGAVIVSWLPLYHDMGLITGFLLPCWRGVPIVSLDPFAWIAAPTILLDAIERHRATHLWMPNFAFLVLARHARGKAGWALGSLRAVVSCSEPCKPEAFDAFLARFGPMGVGHEALQTCYAMAETVFAVSQSEIGVAPRRRAVSRSALAAKNVEPPETPADSTILLGNGKPISGCEVRILSQDGWGAERQIGEIVVKSGFMFDAYYRNQAATRDAFYDGGWYRTGDIGFLDAGEVFVVGRLKDVIIVNGKNIFAHDVEAAVSTVAGVKPGRCVAFGRFSERVGSEQMVVIAERSGESEEQAILLAINQAVLEECGVPCADIRLVGAEWLVKTTSGKMSRSENAQKYAAALSDATTNAAVNT